MDGLTSNTLGFKGISQGDRQPSLAFADFAGNKQYITMGNLLKADRVAMIRGLFEAGSAQDSGHAPLKVRRRANGWPYRSPRLFCTVERVFVIDIEAYDWNCLRHITPRYTEQEIESMLPPIHAHKKLEQEDAELRKQLAQIKA